MQMHKPHSARCRCGGQSLSSLSCSDGRGEEPSRLSATHLTFAFDAPADDASIVIALMRGGFFVFSQTGFLPVVSTHALHQHELTFRCRSWGAKRAPP